MKDTKGTKNTKSRNNQLTGEQVLYIGPEENVTDVRQRLDQADAQYITLVVPSQTQLRGQVTWKLLHVRAQERGQDVSIVSNDPYVRAMAQSVHFRVIAVNSTTPKSKVS